VVDDKPENLVAIRTVLKDLEVELIEVTSGNEALKATLKHDFALALLDIQMPDMDGYELAQILREEEKTQDLPFIFISAVYTDNNNIFKGYEKGAFSFIAKPFEPQILINKVKFFIEKHKQSESLKQLNEELRIKNREMEIANKDLESFSYSISHDLRAPLRSINGFSEILMMNHAETLDPQAKRYLERIVDNGVKMHKLIDTLLNLSKLGKHEMVKEDIDMNALVNSIIHDYQVDVNHSKINWKISNLPTFHGDAELMKQVLVNLISNAVKYSSKKDNPEVEIACENDNGKIKCWVKDNGAGFDMSFKDKLFDVFQRLHTPSEFEGNGVGLAIVKRIIKKHDGEIWAESELEKGSTFYFTLPNS